MSVASLWNRLEPTISAEPAKSLAAYVGHKPSIAALANAGLIVPDIQQFAKEEELNPNPFNLELPEEYLRMLLLIRGLAFWGSEALTRAAVACSELQIKSQRECDRSLIGARDAARTTASEFISNPDGSHRERARNAASNCQALYKPFEDSPDSEDASKVWYHLGAPWFAAETTAEDFSLTEWDGFGPAPTSPSWGNRNSVWPQRAADAAVHWTSYPETRNAILTALIDWTMSGFGDNPRTSV